MIRVLLSGAVFAAFLAAPAVSQNSEPESENALAACSRIEDDQARLACFDLAVRSAEPGQSRAPASAPAEPAARSASIEDDAEEAGRFGLPDPSRLTFGLPDISLPSLGPADSSALAESGSSGQTLADVEIIERNDEGDPSKILLVVDEVRTVGYSTRRFHMTNGQVWEVTDGMRVNVPRTEPLTAEIRVAGLGGYFLRLNGEGRAMRVRRVD